MKCVFDMGNFVLDGYNPKDAYNTLRDHVKYYHIKDALYAGAIVPAGKGEAQISEILNEYKRNGAKDTYITLEPHLQTFSGLNALVGKSFDNPYKYNDQKEAFTDAVEKLRGLL
jgi:sugar phosphate isomerase/epimerase